MLHKPDRFHHCRQSGLWCTCIPLLVQKGIKVRLNTRRRDTLWTQEGHVSCDWIDPLQKRQRWPGTNDVPHHGHLLCYWCQGCQLKHQLKTCGKHDDHIKPTLECCIEFCIVHLLPGCHIWGHNNLLPRLRNWFKSAGLLHRRQHRRRVRQRYHFRSEQFWDHSWWSTITWPKNFIPNALLPRKFQRWLWFQRMPCPVQMTIERFNIQNLQGLTW